MAIALVTGASRGIGLELARLLRARGMDVVCASRSVPPADAGLVHVPLDLEDDASLDTFPARLAAALPGGAVLDVLVLNAGLMVREAGPPAVADVRRQFEINALGPLRIALGVADRLAPGAKVGLVTSRMGSIGDNTSGGMYGYRMSKAALDMAGVSLAHALRPRGIAVVLLHPGFVRTALTGGRGDLDPRQSAELLLARLDALTVETTGRFLHANGTPLPW